METHNTINLHILVNKILDYEPSLFKKIKDQVFYKFKDNDDIRRAVKMWNVKWSRYTTIMLYGHISLWYTSNITDM